MAVYTHFGGMDGVRQALRQEGFTRLAARCATVAATEDPVRDLTALVAAYVRNALDHPDLHRVMFDANFALEDGEAAQDTLEHLVRAAERRWAMVHGLVSLVATGPLPPWRLQHGPAMLVGLFAAAGDAPGRCRVSVAAGWADAALPALEEAVRS